MRIYCVSATEFVPGRAVSLLQVGALLAENTELKSTVDEYLELARETEQQLARMRQGRELLQRDNTKLKGLVEEYVKTARAAGNESEIRRAEEAMAVNEKVQAAVAAAVAKNTHELEREARQRALSLSRELHEALRERDVAAAALSETREAAAASVAAAEARVAKEAAAAADTARRAAEILGKKKEEGLRARVERAEEEAGRLRERALEVEAELQALHRCLHDTGSIYYIKDAEAAELTKELRFASLSLRVYACVSVSACLSVFLSVCVVAHLPNDKRCAAAGPTPRSGC